MKIQMNPTSALAGLGISVLGILSASSAWAQNRFCVVDDVSWEVVCGRQASQDEINDYYAQKDNRPVTPANPAYAQAPAYRAPPAVVQQAPVYVPPPQPQVVQQPIVVTPTPQPNFFEIIAQSQNRRPVEEERMTEREARRHVGRLFQEVLGREADYLSLQNFSNSAVKGRSLEDIRLELARSEEAKEAIRRMYREILKREADSSGLNNFQQKLIAGASLVQIRNELASSDEAKRRR